MLLNEYQAHALRTWNHDQDDLAQEINAVMGLCGESGEIADLVKKQCFHGHPENIDAIVKEMGDVMYYLAVLGHLYGVSLAEVAYENVEKLRKRYPEGFSAERSVNRSGE